MLKIIHTSSDAALAQRISSDFQQAGYEVGTGAPERGEVVIVILSPAADEVLQSQIERALDLSLHIIPVEAQPAPPPALIAHLGAVDFSEQYDFPSLRTWVDTALSPNAGLPLRTLTPKVKRSNRSAGILLALIVLVMFAVGLYGVGVMKLQAPVEEYNSIDTMVALTRDILVSPEMQLYGQFFPFSTDDAANYAATLRAIPTVYRPLIAMTATALVATPAAP